MIHSVNVTHASEKTLVKIERAFSQLKSKNNREITIHLKCSQGMEKFPLKILAGTLGFEFRIPLKNGGINKAFHFYTTHLNEGSFGHLQDLYPGYGIKEDYKLRGCDLMRLIDVVAKVFELSEITVNDKSSCWEVEGIKELEGEELEKELFRFAELHHLSMEKDQRNRYLNNIIQKYYRSLIVPPGCFELKYSRAMIKGNSWYGDHGYYPASMTPEEYFIFIDKLRATDLCQCFQDKSAESSFMELMYREFAIYTGKDKGNCLGDFFIWLSSERPHAIADVIKDIRGARAGAELQRKFYDIEDFSSKMVKRYK